VPNTANIHKNYSMHSMFPADFSVTFLFMEEYAIAVSRRNDLKRRFIGLSKTATTGSRIPASLLIGAALLIIPCISAFSQSTSSEKEVSANELLRKTVDSELKAQSNDHSHWMYEVTTKDPGKEQVKWIVETREGDIARLRSVNGRPITREQQQEEDQRIESLLHRPSERKKQQRAQQEDARQTENLFKMLPDAFNAKFGEHKNGLVEILIQPNPNFHPSSHEAEVFHTMGGRIWIDEKQNRLAEIEGHLIHPVKFYGGLLGHLDEGGTFHVKQSEVGPGYWEVTLLHVDMRGKALFFKTISVQQNEVRTNFQRVPDNMTLAQSADELQKQCTAQTTARAAGMR
jgi:hypothetical protein